MGAVVVRVEGEAPARGGWGTPPLQPCREVPLLRPFITLDDVVGFENYNFSAQGRRGTNMVKTLRNRKDVKSIEINFEGPRRGEVLTLEARRLKSGQWLQKAWYTYGGSRRPGLVQEHATLDDAKKSISALVSEALANGWKRKKKGWRWVSTFDTIPMVGEAAR